MNDTLALIGKGASSYGCGVLVTFNQVKYIASAGHVIRAMGGCPAWAIHGPTLKCTQNPIGGYAIMALVDELIDIQGKTDLAICHLTRDINSDTVNLDDRPPAGNLIGQPVVALGYPVDYVLEHLKRESEEHLPSLQARGVITGVFDENIVTSGGTEIAFRGGFYVKMDNPLPNHGSGFSGALVVSEHSNMPLGIITGGTESGDLIFSPIESLRALMKRL